MLLCLKLSKVAGLLIFQQHTRDSRCPSSPSARNCHILFFIKSYSVKCVLFGILICISVAGWHHQLDGRESEWTPGVGDGQGGLACCSSWGRKESDMTELLNWTEHPVMLSIFNVLISLSTYCLWASLVAQMVKNPPALRETCIQSLGWEDPLE